MDAEAWQQWTGIAAAIWFISALVVLWLQLRIWPDDQQKWSATMAVGIVAIILGHLCLSYLFGWSMGNTPRGVVLFISGAVTWAWFAVASAKHVNTKHRLILRAYEDWRETNRYAVELGDCEETVRVMNADHQKTYRALAESQQANMAALQEAIAALRGHHDCPDAARERKEGEPL